MMHCEKNETKFPDFPIIVVHFFKANYESSTLILTPTLEIGRHSSLGKEPQLLCRKMKNGLSSSTKIGPRWKTRPLD